MPRRTFFTMFLLAILLGTWQTASAQRPGREFKPPEDVAYRRADIYSEGTRLQAEIFSLKASAGEQLPTIIMSHGWGGVAALLRPEAVFFAQNGYLVVTFDYRGWGESDGRVILTEPAPSEKSENKFVAEVREIREVVDPLDQVNDLLNVLHWVQGEPQCNTDRIGLWGSSYSGGHVVFAAAHDHRVKATVSQVPGMDSRFVVANDEERELTYSEATQRARGELGYPEPGARVIGNLRGAPIRDKLKRYAPVDNAGEASPECAMLFVVAENEELFDNNENGVLAHERVKGPKKLIVVPEITHYGIYTQARLKARGYALAWYDEHLKK